MLKQNLKLEGVKALSKKEQRAVKGGGTCAYQGGNGWVGVAGVSKAEALWGASITGGNWCCDSCANATWLDQDIKDYLAQQ